MKTKSKQTCQFCKYWEGDEFGEGEAICFLLSPDNEKYFHEHELNKYQKIMEKAKKMFKISMNLFQGENIDDISEEELSVKKDVSIHLSIQTNKNFGCNQFKKIK